MSRSLGVTAALRDLLPEWTVRVFEALAMLGDLSLVIVVLGVAYAADVVRSEPGAERLCSDRTAFLVAVVFGGLALIVALKALFGLPRPPAELHAIPKRSYGFPSGHTMAATILWGALALWSDVWNRRRRVAVAVTAVALVAVSRLALGVHFAVDVVASVVFGVGYLLAVHRLTAGDPVRAFAGAIGLAVLAVLVSGASQDALLALAGTALGLAGWWTLERPIVRRRVERIVV